MDEWWHPLSLASCLLHNICKDVQTGRTQKCKSTNIRNSYKQYASPVEFTVQEKWTWRLSFIETGLLMWEVVGPLFNSQPSSCRLQMRIQLIIPAHCGQGYGYSLHSPLLILTASCKGRSTMCRYRGPPRLATEDVLSTNTQPPPPSAPPPLATSLALPLKTGNEG